MPFIGNIIYSRATERHRKEHQNTFTLTNVRRFVEKLWENVRIYGKQNYMNMKNHRLGCSTICAKYMCCEKVENMKYTLLNVKYFVDVIIQKKYITMFLTFYGHDGRSLIIMEAQHTVHGFIWKVHRWHLLERRPFGPPSLRKEWSLHEPSGVFCLSLLCMEVIILSCVAAPNSITQKGICLLIEFSQTSDAKLLISAH